MVAAAFAAIAFAAKATPRTELGDLRPAIAALAGWAFLSAVGPQLTESPLRPLDGDPNALVLIAVGRRARRSLTLGILGAARAGGVRGAPAEPAVAQPSGSRS